MNSFFSTFDKSSLSQWKDQIIQDLKGKEHSVLEFHDPIEELDYKAYYHQDETASKNEAPGNFPYTRGLKTSDNNWMNGALIEITDESNANKEALALLMKGADLLVFKTKKTDCDWNKVLSEIKLEYIKAQFDVPSIKHYTAIKEIVGNQLNTVSFNFDPMAIGLEIINELIEASGSQQHPVLVVNGFGVQQLGATSWQEIAFSINIGHEYLLKLMESGLSIDEVSILELVATIFMKSLNSELCANCGPKLSMPITQSTVALTIATSLQLLVIQINHYEIRTRIF